MNFLFCNRLKCLLSLLRLTLHRHLHILHRSCYIGYGEEGRLAYCSCCQGLSTHHYSVGICLHLQDGTKQPEVMDTFIMLMKNNRIKRCFLSKYLENKGTNTSKILHGAS